MRLRHYDHDGRARFITFSTHKDLPVLTNSLFREIVVDGIVSHCRLHKLRLLAYVVMPEHVHLVNVPSSGLEVGPNIGELKRQLPGASSRS